MIMVADNRSQISGKTILIADDNETNRDLLKAFLLRENYRVVSTVDGQAAVNAAKLEAFDAILLDISMPVLDGLQAAKLIRESSAQNKQAPIAALSAYALDSRHHELEAAGITGIFRKPVNWSDLMQWLHAPGTSAVSKTLADGQSGDLIRADILLQLTTALPPETIAGLFSRFQADINDRLARLVQAAGEQDRESILKLSHAICGIASAFGAHAVEEVARGIHNNPNSILTMPESDELDRLKTIIKASELLLQKILQP